MKTIADNLGKFAEKLTFSELPEEVILQAKRIFLDTLGCMIGAYETTYGKKFVDTLGTWPQAEEAVLIGKKTRYPWVLSAMGNSYLADLLDFEQTLTGHESATIVPAALSAGEVNKASGKQVITAIVAAYEVQTRIGLAIAPSPARFKEIASPSIEINHVFGASVCAGKLFALNAQQVSRALSMAGDLSPIPTVYKFLERPASLLKGKYWWCTYAGCFSVVLARAGFYGPQDLLGGDHGYWICAGSDQCDFQAFTKELSTSYNILNDSFKPYPSCRWTHCALDAVFSICESKNLTAQDISSITVKTSLVIKDFNLDDANPTSMIDAEFSLPYCIAMVILRKDPGLLWHTPELLTHPDVLSICAKVKVITDEKMNKYYFDSDTERANPAFVEIEAAGTKYRVLITCPLGDPKNPMNDKELEKKFTKLAYNKLGEKTEKCIDLVKNLEELKDISSFADLLLTV
jgi:2-methylcitrate dehydratase PrpD